MKIQSLVVLLCLSTCIAAGGLFLREPRSGSSGRPAVDRPAAVEHREFDGLPGPLIQRDGVYLSGRDLWLSEYFNRFFLDSLSPEARLLGAPRVTIHRQPFSDGPWLQALEEPEAAKRTSTESQTVEAEFEFELADVPPGRLLQFLVFSGYEEKIEGIGELERERFFSPLETPLAGLGELAVASNQFVVHERTQRPEFLARPTACYYLFDVRRFGDAYLLRYDLLANSRAGKPSGKDPAIVHLSAGQYALVPADRGTRLRHIAFYSGQSVPFLFDEFVKNQTVDYFQEVASTIRSLAPEWDNPPEAETWLETALDS